MNTNLVKINNITLVSMDLLEIETGADEPFNDYRTSFRDLDPSITGDDTIEIKCDDDISLKEDGTTEILGGRFLVRVNEHGDLAAVVREITEPGIYELIGVVNTSNMLPTEFFNISAKSITNPSLLYYDLDDKDGRETLDFFTLAGTDKHTIGDENLTYTTTLWIEDSYEYISWLGDKYRKVPTDWVISEELVDEDEDDDHLLRVGETLSLPEGFAITAIEIDVDGEEAWISLTNDGEEIDNEVVSTAIGKDSNFVYEDDFDEADDVEIMNFTVDTVFAGMNTNLVKINNITLVSMDLLEIETGADEPFNDYRTSFRDLDPSITGDDTIEIKCDDDISLKEDGTTEILGGRFLVRVNEHGDLAAVAKEINVGGVVVTPTPTEDLTVEPTEEPTNVTAVEPGVPTEGPTEVATEEVPTPEPTEEPGFEAVFAVAGLLAVAYLVLRQRE
jgi:S-layer protein (TIGR01567 family)